MKYVNSVTLKKIKLMLLKSVSIKLVSQLLLISICFLSSHHSYAMKHNWTDQVKSILTKKLYRFKQNGSIALLIKDVNQTLNNVSPTHDNLQGLEKMIDEVYELNLNMSMEQRNEFIAFSFANRVMAIKTTLGISEQSSESSKSNQAIGGISPHTSDNGQLLSQSVKPQVSSSPSNTKHDLLAGHGNLKTPGYVAPSSLSLIVPQHLKPQPHTPGVASDVSSLPHTHKPPVTQQAKKPITNKTVGANPDVFSKLSAIENALQNVTLWDNPIFPDDADQVKTYLNDMFTKLDHAMRNNTTPLTVPNKMKYLNLLEESIYSIIGIKNPNTDRYYPRFLGRVGLANPDRRCASNAEAQQQIHNGFVTLFVALFKLVGDAALILDNTPPEQILMLRKELNQWVALVEKIAFGNNRLVQSKLSDGQLTQAGGSPGNIKFPIKFFTKKAGFYMIEQPITVVTNPAQMIEYFKETEWRAITLMYNGHHYTLLKENNGNLTRVDDRGSTSVPATFLDGIINHWSATGLSVYYSAPRINLKINQDMDKLRKNNK